MVEGEVSEADEQMEVHLELAERDLVNAHYALEHLARSAERTVNVPDWRVSYSQQVLGHAER